MWLWQTYSTIEVCLLQALFQMYTYWQSGLRLSDILDFVLHCSAPWCIQSAWCWLDNSTDCMTLLPKLYWVAHSKPHLQPPTKVHWTFARFQSCHFEALQLTGWRAELGLRANMCNNYNTKQRWAQYWWHMLQCSSHMLHICICTSSQHLQLLPCFT